MERTTLEALNWKIGKGTVGLFLVECPTKTRSRGPNIRQQQRRASSDPIQHTSTFPILICFEANVDTLHVTRRENTGRGQRSTGNDQNHVVDRARRI
jgi:hypothetical protein